MAYESRDCSYIKNPQLLLQLADREEEEAQQLPDFFSTEADDASSSQKGLVQDLTHPLWSL